MAYRGLIYAISLVIALLPAAPSKAETARSDPSATVNAFLHDVWGQGNPDAIDKYMAEDFVITTGGKDIRTRDAFKNWVVGFQSKISDIDFKVLETIQSPDGKRVVTRMELKGKNNGMFGLEPDQKPFVLTATAIWAVAPDGRLKHNWVERNAWEVYRQLTEN